jgi:hypothetical protein
MLRFDHAYPLLIKGVKALGLAATLGAALSGCGFRFAEPREPWRGEAEAACMRSGIVKQSSFIRPTKPIDGPGPCGADLPLRVSAFEVKKDTLQAALASMGVEDFGLGGNGFAGLGNVTNVKPEATLGCPMVAWTEDWIAGAVQPAALAWFGQGVREIRAGSYACRRRNHQARAKLSEHSFGNALDVMAFVLNDGYVVTIKGGWRGTPQEQGFLRDTFFEACQRFKTVLGPGSDALHYDHFHLDLAHHDARGTRRYCKPVVSAAQRPAPGTYGPGANPGLNMPPLNAMAPTAPQVNQQMMASTNQPWRAAPNLSARPLAPLSAPLPAPAGSALDAQLSPASGQAAGEVEPDFDPRDFDMQTGSISDLPLPRPVVAKPVVVKPATGPRATSRKRHTAAPARGAAYDPAGRN